MCNSLLRLIPHKPSLLSSAKYSRQNVKNVEKPQIIGETTGTSCSMADAIYYANHQQLEGVVRMKTT